MAGEREPILAFLRELCAIPSMDSQIREVGERAEAEMRRLGFGRSVVGPHGQRRSGASATGRASCSTTAISTPWGIGHEDEWDWDPFAGVVRDGVLFARGACDEKGSTPGMIYGLALARELGLLEGITGYYFGNMEEWNDGSAPDALYKRGRRAAGLRSHR